MAWLAGYARAAGGRRGPWDLLAFEVLDSLFVGYHDVCEPLHGGGEAVEIGGGLLFQVAV